MNGMVSTSALSVGLLYAQPADAWFWFIGRLLAGFVGRTVGRSAVRAAARTVTRTATRTASRPIRQRTGQYISTMGQYYRRNERRDTYPALEYVGKEFGQYVGEQTYDYLAALNQFDYGGIETAVSDNRTPYSENYRDYATASAGFITNANSVSIPTVYPTYLKALDNGAKYLLHRGFSSAKTTGLIYPTEVLQNNMIPSLWADNRETIFKTAFGFISLRVHTVSRDEILGNLEIQDSISGKGYKVTNLRL